MKVLDDGVEIALSGRHTDTMFIWALAMLTCAVLVAAICFTLPVPYAIGAVAVWAVLMYFFNQKKHAAKTQKYHDQGTLMISAGRLEMNGLPIVLSEQARVICDDSQLIVHDRGLSHYFIGFGDDRELQVAKAVLDGQKIAKREKAISLHTTD